MKAHLLALSLLFSLPAWADIGPPLSENPYQSQPTCWPDGTQASELPNANTTCCRARYGNPCSGVPRPGWHSESSGDGAMIWEAECRLGMYGPLGEVLPNGRRRDCLMTYEERIDSEWAVPVNGANKARYCRLVAVDTRDHPVILCDPKKPLGVFSEPDKAKGCPTWFDNRCGPESPPPPPPPVCDDPASCDEPCPACPPAPACPGLEPVPARVLETLRLAWEAWAVNGGPSSARRQRLKAAWQWVSERQQCKPGSTGKTEMQMVTP